MKSNKSAVPYLSAEAINRVARAFLHTYHPSGKLPVPIEDIAELSLKITILPISKLETYCGYDGFITGNFSTIMIDERVYTTNVARARFTIAHELGHLMLHRAIYDLHDISDQDDFLHFQNAFEDVEWGYLEAQANKFAESLLFPINNNFRAIVDETIKKSGGLEFMTFGDHQSLVESITATFFVSGSCALVKLKKEYPELIKSMEKKVPF